MPQELKGVPAPQCAVGIVTTSQDRRLGWFARFRVPGSESTVIQYFAEGSGFLSSGLRRGQDEVIVVTLGQIIRVSQEPGGDFLGARYGPGNMVKLEAGRPNGIFVYQGTMFFSIRYGVVVPNDDLEGHDFWPDLAFDMDMLKLGQVGVEKLAGIK